MSVFCPTFFFHAAWWRTNVLLHLLWYVTELYGTTAFDTEVRAECVQDCYRIDARGEMEKKDEDAVL
jgi:hypothetical protein